MKFKILCKGTKKIPYMQISARFLYRLVQNGQKWFKKHSRDSMDSRNSIYRGEWSTGLNLKNRKLLRAFYEGSRIAIAYVSHSRFIGIASERLKS